MASLMIQGEVALNSQIFSYRNYNCIYILTISSKVRGEVVNMCLDFRLLEILDYNSPCTPARTHPETQGGGFFFQVSTSNSLHSQYIFHLRGGGRSGGRALRQCCVGGGSYQGCDSFPNAAFDVLGCHVGGFKPTMMGIFTPQKMTNAINQEFFFF